MLNVKISVYIVSHNYGKYLSQAVESVLKQTFEDYEILIFDDGSSDNTQDIIESYKHHRKIRAYKTDNIGLLKICNMALNEAKGKYIIRLDGDDYFDENILSILYAHITKRDNTSVVVPDYYLINESNTILSYTKVEDFSNQSGVELPPNGACSLIDVEILKKVGGYSEDILAQDGYELWIKMKDISNIVNVHLPLFYYRRHRKNLTNKKNRLLIARKQIKTKNIDVKSVKRPIIALIPARENYDFIPNLWSIKLKNETLLDISIQKCISSDLFDYIIVASDTDEAKKVMSNYSDKRLRYEKRITIDTLRSIKPVKAFKDIVYKYDNMYEGIVVFSYIHAPFVRKNTLEEAVHTLIVHQSDTSFGLESIEEAVYKIKDDSFQLLNDKLANKIEPLYKDANIAFATRSINFKRGSFENCNIVNFIIDKRENFVINSQLNLEVARVLHESFSKDKDIL